MASRWGGKWLVGVSVLTTTSLDMLTPTAARLAVWLMIANGVLQGLIQVGHTSFIDSSFAGRVWKYSGGEGGKSPEFSERR